MFLSSHDFEVLLVVVVAVTGTVGLGCALLLGRLGQPRPADPLAGIRAMSEALEDGGAGLGLAIARGLVEAHDGEISISNDGPGCRVRVRLPA